MTIQKKTSKKPLFKLENISIKIDGQLVFRNTNWIVHRNEHWAITGPNGSGKSLLADIVFRAIEINGGCTRYYFNNEGEGVLDKSRSYFNQGEIIRISALDHISLLNKFKCGYHQARWQSFEGQKAPTVSELLSGKSIEHVSRFEVTPMRISATDYQAKRDIAIKMLGIQSLLDRKFPHLSNGELRKVLIARALMQSPKVLILDDPFCGLDHKTRLDFQTGIEELIQSKGPTIILITSRPADLPDSITHIAIVKALQISQLVPMIKETGSISTHKKPISSPGFTLPPELGSSVTDESDEEKNTTIIEIKNTSVVYGKTQILKDINWTVKQSENWAILGPNGAGKSTLLSLILADNPQAYSNEISLFGKKRGSGETIWDIKKNIGWVAPELQLYYKKDSTCHHVICSGFFDSIGLYHDYTSEQSITVTKWMRSMKIEHLADHSFGKTSIGEQRLILIARAVVKNPRLLILDEPCQGLDLENRTQIIGFLDMLCSQSSISIIYVTHYDDEIPKRISRVLRLEKGKMVPTVPAN